jgi:type I restriction enzyme R subunit
VLEDEETEAAAQLVTSWAKLEKVVGAPDRIEKVADHLAEHFKERCEVLAGKAMAVAYSRKVAAALTDLLRERLGEEVVECVISAQATDPPEISRFRRNKPELRDLAKRFRDPDDPLRVVVVKDMWLTGFDAPVLHTLYIDKPMRDHGLLQAIARVNRVFKDKPGGLVVDYIGIGQDLRNSLQAYDDADLDDPVIPAFKAVARLVEKYEVICAQLHPAGYREGELHLNQDQAQLFLDCYDLVLATDESIEEFLDAQAALSKWYALARTQASVIELRDEIGWFNRLAAEVRRISTPSWQASKEAEQAIRQFMSEGLAAGEIVDVFGLAGKERPELSLLSDEFLDSLVKNSSQHENATMRAIQQLLDDQVKGRMRRTNPIQAKQFSDEIDAVLLRYQNRQLTSAEVVERLVEIAKRVRDAHHRHEQLGLTEEETAFYDALAGGATDIKGNPELAKLAHELVESIRADLTVDWTDRGSTEAKIRSKIKRLLRHRRDVLAAALAASGSNGGGNGGGAGGHTLDEYADLILAQAKALYRYWPDIEDRLFEEYEG